MSVVKHFILWRFGLARAETQTTEAERECLADYARGKRCLVEIGVWHGVTTCRLRSAMAPDGILYAVDPYPLGRLGISFQQKIAQSEVGRARNGRVEWVRKTGAEAAKDLAPAVVGRVDLIFIDGNHSYEGLKEDWEGWSGLLAPGGVVGLHDSRPTPDRPIEGAGSVRYTSEVIRQDNRFQVCSEVDSLTVLRRRSG